MKAFFDKIILLIGVLALAAGAGYYFMEQGKGTEPSALVNQQPSGTAYEPIDLPEVPAVVGIWNEPLPFDEKGLELYDVFTPPKIYWDEINLEFIFEIPQPPEPPIPFGLALRAFEQELYRIQMEAFVGRGEGAAAQIYDSVTQQSYRGKVGTHFPEIDTKIVALENKLESNPDGTMRRIPRVTLLDGASGQEITLTTDERLYIPNEYKILFEVLRPYPSQEFVWEDVGDIHEVGSVTFKLLDFDFDNQTATVEKTSPDLETETKTLIATGSNTSTPDSAETVEMTEKSDSEEEISTDSQFSEGIDALFQN